MGIAVRCEHCGHRAMLKDNLAGLRVLCPGCGQSLRVPDLDDNDFGAASEYTVQRPRARAEPSLESTAAPADREILQTKMVNGANWFFWIAALSVVNSVILLC